MWVIPKLSAKLIGSAMLPGSDEVLVLGYFRIRFLLKVTFVSIVAVVIRYSCEPDKAFAVIVHSPNSGKSIVYVVVVPAVLTVPETVLPPFCAVTW